MSSQQFPFSSSSSPPTPSARNNATLGIRQALMTIPLMERRHRTDSELEREVGDAQQYGNMSAEEFLIGQRGRLDKRRRQIEADLNNVRGLDIIKTLTGTAMQMIEDKLESARLPDGTEGIDRNGFVKLMSEVYCKHKHVHYCPEHVSQDFHELFVAIDLDGGGSVSWDEFSSYMLNAMSSMGTHSEVLPSLKQHPARMRPTGYDGHAFTKMQYTYLPIIDKILCMDHMPTTTHITLMSPITFKDVTSFVIPSVVTCGAYVPHMRALVFASSTGHMYTFGQGRFDSKDPTAVSEFKSSTRAYVDTPPLLLKWSEGAEALIGATRKGQILSYALEEDSYLCEEKFCFPLHKGTVTDFLVLEKSGRIISCAMGGELKISNLHDGRVVMDVKTAHEVSFSTLSFQEETNLMLTTGSYLDPHVWMPVSIRSQLVGTLHDATSPHKGTIIAGYIGEWGTSTQNLGTTIDDTGYVKVWDLRRMACVESVYVMPNISKEQRTSFHVKSTIRRNNDVIVSTQTVKKQEQLVILSPGEIAVAKKSVSLARVLTNVLYNHHTQTVVIVVDTAIEFFDAKTGQFLFKVADHGPSAITCAVLDDKGRRIFFGTHSGQVRSVSSSTGIAILDYHPHESEVTVLCHCATPKYIVSGSVEGVVLVYTDRHANDPEPMYRLEIPSIRSLAFSNRLCLFVLGDAKETFSVYDAHNELEVVIQNRMSTTQLKVQSGFRREVASEFNAHATETDIAVHEYVAPSQCEIVSCLFLDPFPLLVVADTGATMTLSAVRPYPYYVPLCIWNSRIRSMKTRSVVSVVTAMAFHDTTSTLYSADDQGTITVWHMADVIGYYEICPAEFPPNEEAQQFFASLTEPELFPRPPSILHTWEIAGNVSISSLVLVRDTLIVGYGCGHVVLASRIDGTQLGCLCTEPSALPVEVETKEYRFDLPPTLDYDESSQFVRSVVLTSPRSRYGSVRRGSAAYAAAIGRDLLKRTYRFDVMTADKVAQLPDAPDKDEEVATPPPSPRHSRTPPGSPVTTHELWPKMFVDGYYRLPAAGVLSQARLLPDSISTMNKIDRRDDRQLVNKVRIKERAEEARRLGGLHETVDCILTETAEQLDSEIGLLLPSPMVPLPEKKNKEAPTQHLSVHVGDDDESEMSTPGSRMGSRRASLAMSTMGEDAESPAAVFLRRPLKPLSIPHHLRACLYSLTFLPDTNAPDWVRREIAMFTPSTFTAVAYEPYVPEEEVEETPEEAPQAKPDLRLKEMRVKESEFATRVRETVTLSELMPQVRPRRPGSRPGSGQQRQTTTTSEMCHEENDVMNLSATQLPNAESLQQERTNDDDTHHRQIPDVPLQDLIDLSAPSYPLSPSPYLELQRTAPAISPFIFMKVSESKRMQQQPLLREDVETGPMGASPNAPTRDDVPPPSPSAHRVFQAPRCATPDAYNANRRTTSSHQHTHSGSLPPRASSAMASRTELRPGSATLGMNETAPLPRTSCIINTRMDAFRTYIPPPKSKWCARDTHTVFDEAQSNTHHGPLLTEPLSVQRLRAVSGSRIESTTKGKRLPIGVKLGPRHHPGAVDNRLDQTGLRDVRTSQRHRVLAAGSQTTPTSQRVEADTSIFLAQSLVGSQRASLSRTNSAQTKHSQLKKKPSIVREAATASSGPTPSRPEMEVSALTVDTQLDESTAQEVPTPTVHVCRSPKKKKSTSPESPRRHRSPSPPKRERQKTKDSEVDAGMSLLPESRPCVLHYPTRAGESADNSGSVVALPTPSATPKSSKAPQLQQLMRGSPAAQQRRRDVSPTRNSVENVDPPDDKNKGTALLSLRGSATPQNIEYRLVSGTKSAKKTAKLPLGVVVASKKPTKEIDMDTATTTIASARGLLL